MRFAISTNWNCHRHKEAGTMFEEIRSLGFDTVELGYETTQTQLDSLPGLVGPGGMSVSSVHAFCPNIVVGRGGWELYSPCDPDDFNGSRKAITALARCAEFAASVGAKAVVLHTGRAPVFEEVRECAAMVADGLGDTPKYQKRLLRMIEKRDKLAGPLLDTLYESLEILLPHYAKCGVSLGMENFPTYDGIPNESEMAELLREFDDMPLAYWHDLGHGQIRHHHRIANHKAIVSGFRRNIAGFHIHDVIFPGNDHQLPGVEGGTVDFKLLRPFVDSDVQFVLEPTTAASAQQLAQSLRFLQEQLSQT